MEERELGKVFKPLVRHYGAVPSGCPSDVLCGLGQVTEGLCPTDPITGEDNDTSQAPSLSCQEARVMEAQRTGQRFVTEGVAYGGHCPRWARCLLKVYCMPILDRIVSGPDMLL